MSRDLREPVIELVPDGRTEFTKSNKVERKPRRVRAALVAGVAAVSLVAALVWSNSTPDSPEPKPAPSDVSAPTTEAPEAEQNQNQVNYFDNLAYQSRVSSYVYSELLTRQGQSLPIFDGIAIINYATGGKRAVSNPIVVTDLQVGLGTPTSRDGVPTKPLAVIGVNADADNQDEILDFYLATEPGITSIEYINREGHDIQELDVAGFGTSPGVLYASVLSFEVDGDYRYRLRTDDNTLVGREYWMSK